MKPVSIPTKRFVQYLAEVKTFDRDHPALDQTSWLLDHFRFSDTEAEYDPLRMLPNIGAMKWKKIAGGKTQSFEREPAV